MADSLSHYQTAYLQMYRIRRFEEQVHQYFLAGVLHGTTHLYIGQEACAVGACMALTPKDAITSTHRGHGHSIAKGGKLAPMMAEILGKRTGYCGGKGGSMHIGHISTNNLGANAVVGGGHAIAVGSALAQKMRQQEAVTLCFFGDGSTNEGSFHEALNLASVWQLPVIFFCENNLYGLSTPTNKAMNIAHISDRAISYGITGLEIDGNSWSEVYQTVVEARKQALLGKPTLVVANTYRIMGHSKSDTNSYRTTIEIETWKRKDPLLQLVGEMLAIGITQEQIIQWQQLVEQELQEACAFAEQSPFPHSAERLSQVYAETIENGEKQWLNE